MLPSYSARDVLDIEVCGCDVESVKDASKLGGSVRKYMGIICASTCIKKRKWIEDQNFPCFDMCSTVVTTKTQYIGRLRSLPGRRGEGGSLRRGK